ncbi:hypothetical protein UFOVP510_54 [uncultured Caudovirales phage]|uniref:Uncharacterized protein n=1 Tax=uncultured Caudovirales phage TaxID=2100421 RepID=A0A6J5MNG8_9CAUD|nr:hypothetical protein UFOVP510_54 [uncultured Caudovirales phage]
MNTIPAYIMISQGFARDGSLSVIICNSIGQHLDHVGIYFCEVEAEEAAKDESIRLRLPYGWDSISQQIKHHLA